jgi:phosphoribosylamine--glycine ligase
MTVRPGIVSDNVDTRDRLRVLVVGSGAREHALAWSLSRSSSVGRLWAAPGNPGIAEVAQLVELPVTDVAGITNWAAGHAIDLVVVGPEAPLALGLTDRLLEKGIRVFGPTQAAAELEWSKSYAKDFMQSHGIPTAPYGVFTDAEAALRFVSELPLPLVVKADGLAAGKGVTICSNEPEAEAAIRAALVDRRFGDAGQRIVIEGFLEGEELSVIALVDGERMIVLPPARDYKRLQEGDEGPNTGGMGSYAPLPELDPGLMQRIRQTILHPVVSELRDDGRPFRGALYAGLMLTRDGPQVLEFNCRFGDPETQVIVPLLDGDLAAVLLQCAEGRLEIGEMLLRPESAVCVVLAAAGYPERPRGGDPIDGIDDALTEGALVFQAGTALKNDALVTNGGRVVSVVGVDSSLAGAAARAYVAADAIQFAGKQSRRDIATVPQPA